VCAAGVVCPAGTGTFSATGVYGGYGGVKWRRIVGWGRVSDNDGHGFIMSSISLLQTIHVFIMSSIPFFQLIFFHVFSIQKCFLP